MVRFILSPRWTDDSLELPSADDAALHLIDLSKATKLKHVVFRWGSLGSGWITMALETITLRHQDLQQISIDVWGGLVALTSPDARWSDLDRLLLKLWDSHSIRPKVVDSLTEVAKTGSRDWVGYLFPEATGRGIIDVVESCVP